MKAIILNQPKDFSIKEIDKPQIKDDEVLIRVKASGICTNDVRDFNGIVITVIQESVDMNMVELSRNLE